ncbi:hypothetical protein AZI86_02370 [Bdellovibrio bacteriovorus]|uniref:Capsule synthesis protein CapA domain-containing protein n=2 Tax=Bdellovibrio bacteriovorus TaxID=959 RepID=A0A150WNK0_BDEBC|nr:hypothetical protein AZI86_02370 [Bdellovibrio bacteriovorus]
MTKFLLITLLTFSAGSYVMAENSSRDFSFSGRCLGGDSAVISFSGDVLPHHKMYQSIMPAKSFAPLWNKTNGLIKEADFSVANLEGPAAMGINASGTDMGDVGWIYDARYYENGPKDPDYDKKVIYSGTNFLFNFHPQILKDLKNTGYDLLTVANNHSLDRKSIGIERTLEFARKIGLPTTGMRMRNEELDSDLYNISIINNLLVAFIGCTESTNGRMEDEVTPRSKVRHYQVLRCMGKSKRISDMITQVAPSVDAVVVLPHWGDENEEEEHPRQRAYAQEWIKAGALAVIGSHPHVLQPWEKFIVRDKNENPIREGVIMYSLGNFVAGQGKPDGKRSSEAKKTGVVAYLGLTKNGSKTEISAVGYTPTYRTGTQIAPLEKMNSMISQIVIPKFGTKNLVRPGEPLGKIFCR